MNLKRRIEAMEKRNSENESAWLQSLPDEELERIVGVSNLNFTEWLKTLTDEELLTIRDGKRGTVNLMGRYEPEKKN
jgi:DNA-binding FadR family transcriptional regulator